MNVTIPPMHGVLHSMRAFDSDDGETQRFSFVLNVTDELDIDKLRDAASQVALAHGIQVALLPNMPIQAAQDSNVDTITEGVVVRATYRATANQPHPFTLDGKTFVGSQQQVGVQRLLNEPGRNVQFYMRLSGAAPTTEDTPYRKAKPHGAIYGNLLAIAPKKTVTKIGNVLDGTEWGDGIADDDDVAGATVSAPQSPSNPQQGGAEANDIPF